jgi:hypothetical protein
MSGHDVVRALEQRGSSGIGCDIGRWIGLV